MNKAEILKQFTRKHTPEYLDGTEYLERRKSYAGIWNDGEYSFAGDRFNVVRIKEILPEAPFYTREHWLLGKQVSDGESDKTVMHLFSGIEDREFDLTVDLQTLENIRFAAHYEKPVCGSCDGKGFYYEKECPECEGEGEVRFSTGFNTYDFDCKLCDGEGAVKSEEPWDIKYYCGSCSGTGVDYKNRDYLAVSGGNTINFHFLYRVASIFKEVRMPSELGELLPVPWKADGFEGVIMPVKGYFETPDLREILAKKEVTV